MSLVVSTRLVPDMSLDTEQCNLIFRTELDSILYLRMLKQGITQREKDIKHRYNLLQFNENPTSFR